VQAATAGDRRHSDGAELARVRAAVAASEASAVIVWTDHDPGDHNDAAMIRCGCGVERRATIAPHYDPYGLVIGIATYLECRKCKNVYVGVDLFGGRA
jgi:hypothetical protein